jgi:hypothetical protein
MVDSESDDDDIVQNAVYCSQCNEYLVSCKVHDYVACDHRMVDGGHEYIRRSSCSLDDDFSLFKNATDDEIKAKLLVLVFDKYRLINSLTSSQLTELVNLSRIQTKLVNDLLHQSK